MMTAAEARFNVDVIGFIRRHQPVFGMMFTIFCQPNKPETHIAFHCFSFQVLLIDPVL